MALPPQSSNAVGIWSAEANAARFASIESSLPSLREGLTGSLTHQFRRDLLAFYKATSLTPHPQLLPFHPDEEDPSLHGEWLHDGSAPAGTAAVVVYDLAEIDTLSVKNWQLDDGSFHGLCFALEHCSTIHTAILFNVHLRGDQVDALFKLLPQTLVTRLHVEWNATQDPLLPLCSPSALTELLMSPSNITTLSLRANALTCDHAAAIALALRSDTTKLEVLNLFDNAIGDDGAIELAYALPFNCTLKSLSLGNTQLTGKAATLLVNVLLPKYVAPKSVLKILEDAEPKIQAELDQAKKAKKKLDRATAIQNLGLPVLETIDGVQYAVGNSTLQDLILSGNTFIDDHDVVAMNESLEKHKAKVEQYLRRIKLQRIPVLKSLAVAHPHVTLLDLIHI